MNSEASRTDWVGALQACAAAGRRAVLVTVAATRGSVPREPGAKMIVTAETLLGTIGGGHLEWKATEIARRLLEGEPVEPLQRFALGASLGQCCGGLAQLLFEPVAATAHWLEVLARQVVAQPDAQCVIVTPVRGPVTQKLLVAADSHDGTLGDAALDASALAAARALLASEAPARLMTLEAGATRNECLLDPVRPSRWHIVLFGAGHVGQAVVRVLGELPCRITWVDSRDTVFPSNVANNITVVATDTPEAEVEAAPSGAYFLVMTHSHPLDEALTEAILRRGRFAYFGLIGSLAKRRRFEGRLKARGIAADRLAAMTCPIGVAGIEDKQPATIAIAVAAELLQRVEANRRREEEDAPEAGGVQRRLHKGSATN